MKRTVALGTEDLGNQVRCAGGGALTDLRCPHSFWVGERFEENYGRTVARSGGCGGATGGAPTHDRHIEPHHSTAQVTPGREAQTYVVLEFGGGSS